MNGNVTVKVESASSFAGMKDVLNFTGTGTLEKTDYGYHLRYTVANDIDGSVVDSDVKLEQATHRAVVINENGQYGYGLLLDPKATTATKIEAGGGALVLNVVTREVSWDLGKKQGSIIFDYTFLQGMQPMSALHLRLDLQQGDIER